MTIVGALLFSNSMLYALRVYVEVGAETENTIVLELDDDVPYDLKRMMMEIEEHSGIPINAQRIFFIGSESKDAEIRNDNDLRRITQSSTMNYDMRFKVIDKNAAQMQRKNNKPTKKSSEINQDLNEIYRNVNSQTKHAIEQQLRRVADTDGLHGEAVNRLIRQLHTLSRTEIKSRLQDIMDSIPANN
jgi:hypothetical protein